eukprot:scaffold8239_cov54-Attheya_sp.AAC.3
MTKLDGPHGMTELAYSTFTKSTRLLRAPHTGHTGHTGTHPHHARIVCHNKEGRPEGLATCDQEVRRET